MYVLRALFSTNSDIQHMPQNSKHILGVTSLWMAIPIYHGFTTPLATLLMCVCAVSTVFWSNAVGGSALHRLDKLLAWLFFAALTCDSFRRWHQGKLALLTIVLIIACIVTFFLLSDIFFRRNYPRLQLISHLLFRYVFYWWSHLLVHQISLADFSVISMAYFGHIALLYQFDMTEWQQDKYWLSCGALLGLIYTTSLAS